MKNKEALNFQRVEAEVPLCGDVLHNNQILQRSPYTLYGLYFITKQNSYVAVVYTNNIKL